LGSRPAKFESKFLENPLRKKKARKKAKGKEKNIKMIVQKEKKRRKNWRY